MYEFLAKNNVSFHSLRRGIKGLSKGLGASGPKGLEPSDYSYSYSIRTTFTAMGPIYFPKSENGIKEEGVLPILP
jgi:hypothetical protein